MITPLYGQLSPLRIPTKTERMISADADVVAYVLAVESADGQQLEAGVISALDSFIAGCKTDGIWSAIKASCILAGARSLSGALVPLVGTAPTNNNFVTGDYNRETGLKGNGSTKRLIANRLNNADPQNSKHLAVYKTEPESTAADSVVLGTRFATSGGHTQLYAQATSGRQYFAANSVDGGFRTGGGDSTIATGLIAVSRNSGTNIVRRLYGVSTNTTNNSTTPSSEALLVFSNNLNVMHSTSRVSFYSIGENLNLALLDTRVSNLMTALAAAIP